MARALLRLADAAGLPTGRHKRLNGLLERVRSVELSGMALSIDESAGSEPYTALTDLLWRARRRSLSTHSAHRGLLDRRPGLRGHGGRTDDHPRRGRERWRQASRETTAHVERILERLPGRERQRVEAMASLAPADRTLARIVQSMGMESGSQAEPTSQRLDTVRGIIDRGRPYRSRHRAVEAFLTSEWPDL